VETSKTTSSEPRSGSTPSQMAHNHIIVLILYYTNSNSFSPYSIVFGMVIIKCSGN